VAADVMTMVADGSDTQVPTPMPTLEPATDTNPPVILPTTSDVMAVPASPVGSVTGPTPALGLVDETNTPPHSSLSLPLTDTPSPEINTQVDDQEATHLTTDDHATSVNADPAADASLTPSTTGATSLALAPAETANTEMPCASLEAEPPADANLAPSTDDVHSPAPASEQKADSEMPDVSHVSIILFPATVRAINALGERYTRFGVCTENPFTEILLMAGQKRVALSTFATSNEKCDLTFQIPTAPTGGDNLEQMFKDACVILDVDERSHAIDAAIARGAKFLADVHNAAQHISTHIQHVSAGLRAADDIRDIVKNTLQEVDAITKE
jgi:hypothetical protein